VEDLALEIPKCNVDPANGFHKEALKMSAIHHERKHQLPSNRGFDRVDAAQDLADLTYDRGGRLRRQARHALTDTSHSFIGVHANEARPIAFEDRRSGVLRIRNAYGWLRPGREPNKHWNWLDPGNTHANRSFSEWPWREAGVAIEKEHHDQRIDCGRGNAQR